MDAIITELVNRFERGGLTRRQLIQGLSALVAAAGAPAPSVAQGSGLNATGIDHMSVLVTDLQRSAEFYRRLAAGEPPPVSVEDAGQVVLWVEKVARAADADQHAKLARFSQSPRSACRNILVSARS